MPAVILGMADDLDTLFPRVGDAWEQRGCVRNGKIGKADSKLTGYDSLLVFASRWIGKSNLDSSVVGGH